MQVILGTPLVAFIWLMAGGRVVHKLGVHPQNHLLNGCFKGSTGWFQLHLAMKNGMKSDVKM